ncbi:spore gernimation protein GerPD [Cohnella faecalis]|uniref:Spore gernimation protein GerPD n=1 Tax=Cohnella faecalis TaxID=2315694 RepID=A0A398CHY9_9BACL|nr:spore gernimation protein GerPD [Cohnella faecalis]RIE00759.1 spore gernimation protein GerPD [Cohnella faecalis]
MSLCSVVLNVNNGPLNVGDIRIIGISSSSALLVGDTDSFALYSFFDTPPESLVVGPLAPLPGIPGTDVSIEGEVEAAEGESGEG